MPVMAHDGNSRRRPLPSWGIAAAVFFGLVLLFLAPYVFLGRSMLPLEFMAVFQPWARHVGELWGAIPRIHNPLLDSLQQYYPRRVYMRDALAHGWLPLWNPGVYGGSPFLATQQGAALYPPAWLLSLLAPEVQFGWSAVLHLALAGAGALLFFRELRLRPAAALTGAVAFAFNGYVVVWLAYPNVTQWTLCWLPLTLWCWERGRRADDLRWYVGSAAVLALNLLGGHGQSSEYLLLTWGCWALFRSWTAPRRWPAIGRGVLLPGMLAVLLALGHVLPTVEFVPRTDRGDRIPWSSVQDNSMPVAQLWTFVIPRLFGDGTESFANQSWLPPGGKAGLAYIERSFYPGASVLVLAAGGLAILRRRRRPDAVPELPSEADHSQFAVFSLAATLLAILWALGTPLYWPLWRLVPGFGNFTAMARIVSIAAWGLACLAALGVHALGDPERREAAFRYLAGAGVLGVLIVGAAYFLMPVPGNFEEFLRGHGFPSAEASVNRDLLLTLVWILAPMGFAVAGRRAPGSAAGQGAWAGWACAAVVFVDLCWFGFGYNPATPPEWARFRTPELQFLQEHAADSRFLSLGPTGRQIDPVMRMPSNLPSVWGLADLSGSDSFVTRRYREWEAALKASSGGADWARPGSPNLRSAAVRYYLTSNLETFPGLRNAVDTEVQEDPAAFPYARLHPFAQAVPTRAELFQALAQPNRAPNVALMSGPDAPSFQGPPAVIPYAMRRPNGNRLLLDGSAAVPGLLVVCEQWDPSWRVWVDGQRARPLPAEGLFTGIPLTAGNHHVELRYEPASFRAGLFGTLAGLALCCGLLAARRRAPQAEATV